jgi:transcriptional regulator with XRE-family HTH domain
MFYVIVSGMDTQPRWDVLAATVTASMRDTNMRQTDLARESGLSIPTVRAFMSGRLRSERPSDYTIRRLEEGLMWKPGAVERILAGEDPQRVLEATADVIPIGGAARELSPELQAELDGRYLMMEDAQEAQREVAELRADAQTLKDRLDDAVARLARLEEAEAKRPRRSRETPSSAGG